jgi:hypothetical protein
MKGIVRTLALTGIVAAAAVAGQAQAQAQAQVGIAIGVAPAPVVYNAYIPPCPGVDFIWTPGYYTGRVWVPGRWVHHDRVYVEHRDYHDYHYDHRGWNYGRR